MAYSELIKDINKIRSFIRDFYVFGFYTREEYAALYHISPRSYDNERRRVESWMREYLRFYQDSSGKKAFLSVDGSSILHNPLYRAYKAKSFTANDVVLHFYLMDLFSDGKMIELSEIEDLLWEEYPETFEIREMPDPKTIRLKLEELTRIGLLTKKKQKNSVQYRISSNQFDLTLPGMQDALSLFSETAPLGVIGSFLLDKRTDSDPVLPPFRFRHHYLMKAIDSETLCELLLAIDEKRRIRMRVDSAFYGSMTYLTLPLRIFVSTENGREYLLSANEEMERFYFTRLDRIVWVEKMEIAPSRDQILELFHLHQDKLWGVSFGSLEKIHAPAHLEMDIAVGESEEFIVSRLMREKRIGSVIRKNPETDGSAKLQKIYCFSVDVYDAVELLPWICTFTGRILRLSCDEPEVIRKYEDYLAQMAGYYSEPDSRQMLSGQKESDRKPSEYRPLLRDDSGTKTLSGTLSVYSSKEKHDLIFHEIYGAYYNALAQILALAVRGELTPGKLYEIVQDKAFEESVMYLPDRLLSGEWPFLNKDLGTNLKRIPAMPLTLIQKRWLKSVMEDPKFRLFLDDEAYSLMSEQLRDVRPLYPENTFCRFDRFTDGDPFHDPEYIGHFRTVLSAIHRKRYLFLLYKNRLGDVREMRVAPLFIEYSGRDDKFRLYARQSDAVEYDEPLRLNIGRILDCKILDESIGSIPKAIVRKDSVVLELIDEENTLERAMFHFSFLEKKTERLDSGMYRITLYYSKADETEIVIRILSFGHQLNVISDGYIREELSSRIFTQRRIFSRKTSK